MAPWVPHFLQSLKNHTQPFTPFTFGTVDPVTSKPRCRTVIFRDFLFHDKRSNVLTFTTDLRGEKVREITNKEGQTAPFEACFYFPDTWEQYRFSGECFVISNKKLPQVKKLYGHDQDANTIKYPILSPSVCGHTEELYKYDQDEDGHKDPDRSIDVSTFSDEENVSPQLSRMSTRSSNAAPDILTPQDYRPPMSREWNMELMRQWVSLSRSTKSQYRKPDPGTPMTSETSSKLDKIQRGVDGGKENTGLENFGVVCLCVDQVDYLNLKDGKGGERWMFRRLVEDETGLEVWEEEEVCP